MAPTTGKVKIYFWVALGLALSANIFVLKFRDEVRYKNELRTAATLIGTIKSEPKDAVLKVSTQNFSNVLARKNGLEDYKEYLRQIDMNELKLISISNNLEGKKIDNCLFLLYKTGRENIGNISLKMLREGGSWKIDVLYFSDFASLK